ncbi:MAG TPA: oligosaccharide flippase family protein [Methylophilus sp.]|nr:oligosaccharide flippase family protein [Methylophilus sp.]HQQ33324.1 oligosaccharide flippase family protein [Methylophilus sp.]
MLKRLFKSKLLGNTAIYALANVLNGAIPFLLLPILTRVFTPEEYGLVTLVSAVIAIMGAFTGLSAHGAVSVKYFDQTVNHPQFVGASLLVLAGSTTFILFFLLLTGDAISSWINLPKQWLFIAAIASAAQFVINIRLTMWQVQHQAYRYGFFQVAQTVFNLAISLVLVLGLLIGWTGRVWAIVFATFLFAFISLVTLKKEGLVNWLRNKDYTREVLAFGMPLIPHTLGGMAIAMSDRFVVSKILGTDAVGILTIATQVSTFLGFFIDGFIKAYSPQFFKILSNISDNDKKNLVRSTYAFYIGLFLVSSIYIYSAQLFIPYLVGESFRTAITYIPWLVYSTAFMGAYYSVGLYIVYAAKTHLLSSITAIIGVMHFFLMYYAVNEQGLLGAAKVSLLSSMLMFLLTWILSARVFPMNWIHVLSGKS